MTALGRAPARRERRRHHDPQRRSRGAVPRRPRLRRGAHLPRERQRQVRDGCRRPAPARRSSPRSRRRCASASATTRGSCWSPSPSSQRAIDEVPVRRGGRRPPALGGLLRRRRRRATSWRRPRHPSTPPSIRWPQGPGVVYWNPPKGSSTDTPVREGPRQGDVQVAHDQSQPAHAREDRRLRLLPSRSGAL